MFVIEVDCMIVNTHTGIFVQWILCETLRLISYDLCGHVRLLMMVMGFHTSLWART